jgi:hypothetical protein
LWRSAGEDEPADEPRSYEYQFLRYEAAEREAEQVDLAGAEHVDEAESVTRHVGDVVRDPAGGGADASVVEQDHLAVLGEAVD